MLLLVQNEKADLGPDLFDAYIDSVSQYREKQRILNKDNRPSPLLVDLLSKERVGVHPGIPEFQGHAPGMLMDAQA
jgi:hypothetical protein